MAMIKLSVSNGKERFKVHNWMEAKSQVQNNDTEPRSYQIRCE